MAESSGRIAGISLAKLLPLIVLVAGLVVFFVFDGPGYFSFDVLHKNRSGLIQWIDSNHMAAAMVFMVVYAVATAFSLPIGLVLTLAGGFLFGPAAAMALPDGLNNSLVDMFGASGPSVLGSAVTTLYIVVGATLGATLVFVAARTAFADLLHAKAGPMLKLLEDGFQRDAMNYLVILRLVPVFPFWLVNLAPAFLGVPLKTYVIATFLGIIPGTFVFALVGNGLGTVFAQCDLRPEQVCEAPSVWSVLLQPGVVLPIVGLILLAGLPLLYKRARARKLAQL